MRCLLCFAILLPALITSCSKGSSPPTGPPGNGGNHAPTVYATSDSTRMENGHSCTVRVTASDADGDQLSFGYAAVGGTVTASGSTATTAIFTATSIGNASVTVTVSDGHGGQSTATAAIYLLRNYVPVITETNLQQFCVFKFTVAETLVVSEAHFADEPGDRYAIDVPLPTIVRPGVQYEFWPDFAATTHSCAGVSIRYIFFTVQRPAPDGRVYQRGIQMH
jgi:hypothetical protein